MRMILKDIYRNTSHGRVLVRFCHAQRKQPELNQKYGYVLTEDGHERRDKENKGVVHLSRINLPVPLKDSLELYYERYPKKQMIDDGLKLARHIGNRGRPTHATWLKYKEEKAPDSIRGGRAQIRNMAKQFSLEDAIREGLVPIDELKKVEGMLGEIVKNQKTDELEDDESLVDEEEMLIDGNIDDETVIDETVIGGAAEHDTLEDELTEETSDKKKKKKRSMKRPQLSSYSVIRYGSRETIAYAACQIPSVYGTTLKVLNEIKKREPDYAPHTLLDFGSGTGMSVWAANTLWHESIQEYQCVDISRHMNEAAEFLLRGSSDINKPLKVPNVYFKQFLPLSNNIKYDLVIAANTLSEMPFQRQRLQAIQSLWRKTNDFLVLIEPGNNEGFEIALQARSYIAGKDKEKEKEYDFTSFEDLLGDYGVDNEEEDVGHIFAPCAHELVCARTDANTRDHPCNFTQKVELSFAYQRTNLKSRGYFDERFSYIIFRKGKQKIDNESSQGWARILDTTKQRRRHVICELCCHNGNIEKHVLTKGKDPDIYKAARHLLKWGDMMPLDKARRPLNIRPSPSCPKKK